MERKHKKFYKTIAIHPALHEDIMLFKLSSKAKNVEEVLKKAMEALRSKLLK